MPRGCNGLPNPTLIVGGVSGVRVAPGVPESSWPVGPSAHCGSSKLRSPAHRPRGPRDDASPAPCAVPALNGEGSPGATEGMTGQLLGRWMGRGCSQCSNLGGGGTEVRSWRWPSLTGYQDYRPVGWEPSWKRAQKGDESHSTGALLSAAHSACAPGTAGPRDPQDQMGPHRTGPCSCASAVLVAPAPDCGSFWGEEVAGRRELYGWEERPRAGEERPLRGTLGGETSGGEKRPLGECWKREDRKSVV